jgi:hypothetical protein
MRGLLGVARPQALIHEAIPHETRLRSIANAPDRCAGRLALACRVPLGPAALRATKRGRPNLVVRPFQRVPGLKD